MPADPESSAGAAADAVENDYDSFAEAYTVENDTSLINAYYARPAIVDLAGDVAGRRILDAGCGAGAVSVALRDRGAIVAGFDRSVKMVELARQRLGADTDPRVTDIAGPLPYPDGAFDDVIAALVLHYLEDWTAPLATPFQTRFSGAAKAGRSREHERPTRSLSCG
jgi:ubiquinone/menaquinone biosynthesis C-methylase UbiE